MKEYSNILSIALITFLILWIGVMLPAQQPAYFTIGEDELKDYLIYTINQGEDGVIYTGTDNGLFAYKHGVFEKIEGPLEQTGSAVFDLKRDNNGDLYCMNFDGQIFQLVNNKLELFYKTRNEHVSNNFNFYFDSNNDIIVASNVLFKIFRKTKNIQIYHIGLLNNIRSFKQISQNHFFFSSGRYADSYELKNDRIYKVSFFDHKKNKIKNAQLHPLVSINTAHTTQRDTTSYITTQEDTIFTTTYIFDDSLQKNDYEYDLNRVFQFNDHEFFSALLKKGIRLYTKENNAIKDKGLWFPNQFISNVTQTKNGEILLGTFGKGINIIPNRNIIKENIIPSNEICNRLANRNGVLYFTTDGNKIYSFNGETLKLEKHHKDQYIAKNIFHVEGFNHYKKNGLDHFIYYGSMKDAWELPNKNILIANTSGLSIFSPKKMNHSRWSSPHKNSFHHFTELKGRTKSVCYAPLSKTIFVSHQGQLLSIDSTYNKISDIFYKGKNINCSDLYFNEGTLYIASQNHGVLILKNGKVSQKYSTKNGLGDNDIKKIKIESNQLFLTHREGLQIINLNNDEIKTIGTAEGIPEGKIPDFETDGKQLWILKNNEILSLQVDSLQPSTDSIILHFDSLTVNDEKIDIQKENVFSHQQRKFDFHLDFHSAVFQNETYIFHKLEGYDKDWTKTKIENYSASFKALDSKNYTYKAYAEYRNKKSEVFTYSFRILPPIWFYISIGLIISAAFYLFYKIRMKQINQLNQAALEKEKAELEMVESELKALRSQMNPHFIFNSLNSIQDLILREETDKSYDYIVLFADLVRSTLNHSNKKFIPVKKELDFLNTYLSLEKLRFKEDFNYTIRYTGSKDIEVPSLVVQPFIENALLHGLLHKKGLKELDIHFEVFEDTIHCSVTDNGIGRQRAKEIRERQRANHESFSMDAIKKRLTFLSGQHEVDSGYEFTDLMDGETSSGTKVAIRMPYKHLF